MTLGLALLILSCVLMLAGLCIVIVSKQSLDRFGVMLCLVGVAIMWVSLVAIGIERQQLQQGRPVPQLGGEYQYPAIAPPLTSGWPCMDGNPPWDDNGRASCLTREESEARAAHRAKALKAWNEQRGDIEEIICANTLTLNLCIEIKSGKTVDPNAE